MRNLHLVCLLAASLLPFASAHAAPANLPETGQTTCYDTFGTIISCIDTGQDGEHKAGVAWSSPRFVVGTGAGVDCVTDNLTGLMWVRAPSATTSTWYAALASADGLALCGFSDWRLPNINELKSLTNSEAADIASFLNAQGFSNVQSFDNYWSSTSRAGSAGIAWRVTMLGGDVSTNSKSVSHYVWPVRAGQ